MSVSWKEEERTKIKRIPISSIPHIARATLRKISIAGFATDVAQDIIRLELLINRMIEDRGALPSDVVDTFMERAFSEAVSALVASALPPGGTSLLSILMSYPIEEILELFKMLAHGVAGKHLLYEKQVEVFVRSAMSSADHANAFAALVLLASWATCGKKSSEFKRFVAGTWPWIERLARGPNPGPLSFTFLLLISGWQDNHHLARVIKGNADFVLSRLLDWIGEETIHILPAAEKFTPLTWGGLSLSYLFRLLSLLNGQVRSQLDSLIRALLKIIDEDLGDSHIVEAAVLTIGRAAAPSGSDFAPFLPKVTKTLSNVMGLGNVMIQEAICTTVIAIAEAVGSEVFLPFLHPLIEASLRASDSTNPTPRILDLFSLLNRYTRRQIRQTFSIGTLIGNLCPILVCHLAVVIPEIQNVSALSSHEAMRIANAFEAIRLLVTLLDAGDKHHFLHHYPSLCDALVSIMSSTAHLPHIMDLCAVSISLICVHLDQMPMMPDSKARMMGRLKGKLSSFLQGELPSSILNQPALKTTLTDLYDTLHLSWAFPVGARETLLRSILLQLRDPDPFQHGRTAISLDSDAGSGSRIFLMAHFDASSMKPTNMGRR